MGTGTPISVSWSLVHPGFRKQRTEPKERRPRHGQLQAAAWKPAPPLLVVAPYTAPACWVCGSHLVSPPCPRRLWARPSRRLHSHSPLGPQQSPGIFPAGGECTRGLTWQSFLIGPSNKFGEEALVQWVWKEPLTLVVQTAHSIRTRLLCQTHLRKLTPGGFLPLKLPSVPSSRRTSPGDPSELLETCLEKDTWPQEV